MPRGRAQDGQATVELIALLPCVAAVLAGLWQAVLVGHTQWAATAAARAAARAQAVGTDPERAARAHLPSWLEPGVRVGADAGGRVRISVRIPGLPGLPSIGHARAAARFEPQS